MKKYYYRLPFWFKLWWAKQFIHMFRGFGPTFHDDLILFNELSMWIETKGKPTSSKIQGGNNDQQ